MEKWPYPNILVYVVCPREGEGCSQTLHRNYLLPINSNMGQGKADESEKRVKNSTSLTPVPSKDSKMWHSNHHKPTSLEVSKFGLSTGTRANQHLGCMGWPVCLFAHSSLFVHHFLERCSVEHTLLITKYTCWAQLTQASRGSLLMQL